jgi:hypothetical protein
LERFGAPERGVAALVSAMPRLGAERCLIDVNPDDSRDAIKVGVVGKQRAPRRHATEAIMPVGRSQRRGTR